MPSPFPGMDPYLEDDSWTNFHAWLAPEIASQLNAQLGPEYAALVNKRMINADYERKGIRAPDRYPDVGIVREAKTIYSTGRGSAVMDPPIVMRSPVAFEEPYLWVEIFTNSGHELITSIEILSPGNKQGRGRTEYLRKRNRILKSNSHLVEIDLLRNGERLPVRGDLPKAPYYVFLSRVERRPDIGIWPIMLNEILPVVPIPVKSPDADVSLNLQAAVTSIYERSRYHMLLDYSGPPLGPLTKEEAAYVDATLSDWRNHPSKQMTRTK